MKFIKRTILRLGLASLVMMMAWFGFGWTESGHAAINPLINFSGKVTNGDGTEIDDGVYDFNFDLYTQAIGGSSIWTEDLTAANMFSATVGTVTNGSASSTLSYSGDSAEATLRTGQYLYNTDTSEAVLIIGYSNSADTITVASSTLSWTNGQTINNRPYVEGGVIDVDLGAVTDLTSVDFDQPLYLEITFNGETMRPRRLFDSVVQAFNADKLDGYDASDFLLGAGDTNVTGLWTFDNILSIATTSAASTTLTVTQSGTGDIINLYDGTNEVFTVLDGGYVGIGTSTPLELLDINGNIGLENQGALRFYEQRSNGANYFALMATSSMTSDLTFTWPGADGSLGEILTTNGAGNLYWSTPSLSAAAGWTDDGTIIRLTDATDNVGIGTSTPYSKLTVWGDGTGTGKLLELVDSASTTRMVVLDNGYVGIGTSSPSSFFSLEAIAGEPILTIASSTGENIFSIDKYGFSEFTKKVVLQGLSDDSPPLYFANTNGDNSNIFHERASLGGFLKITNFSAGIALLPVSGYGVGIGTSTPYSKLTVWGDGTGTGKLLELVDSASSTKFAVLENGNVGIGTANPEYVFSVEGNPQAVDYKGLVNISGTFTNINENYGLQVSPIVAPSGASTKTYVGGVFTPSSSSSNLSGGSLYGIQANPFYSGAGTIGSMYGGYFINSNLGAGTITNAFGIVIGDSVNIGGGSIYNNVGMYIGNMTVGANNYAIYSEGGQSYHAGNFGIGTTSPSYALHVGSSASGKNVMIANGGLCVDDNDACAAGFAAGKIVAKTSDLTGADYAEYFYTKDIDLEPGEVVCVDIEKENAVKRCARSADGNVMGIISSNPSIVGNAQDFVYGDSHYKIVGLLGQIKAKVSAENGHIRAGDSLTSASSTPGYIMRADPGNPTVGVALEGLDLGTGMINILIARRNKSLTVETVEAKITEHIANMEIEDEVQILISNAVDNLNLDDEVNEIVDEQIAQFDSRLTVEFDTVSNQIITIAGRVDSLAFRLSLAENNILDIESRLSMLESVGASVIEIGTSSSFYLSLEGNLKIGNNISTSTPDVAIVELNTVSEKTALVINQAGDGDVADFQADSVSIVNIAETGRVTVVGEMMVDGRLMVCSGGACGEKLDEAVDETMGDMGVEGKVVAGAFEGYCEEGYIWVPGSSKYGTMPGFCVMEDEAKTSSHPSPSQGEGASWVNISQGEAQITCQSIGDGYHLISENEWLTIAENIIRVTANDIDSNQNSLQLATSTSLSAGTSSGGVVYTLSNDNVIYNLVGGVSEWIDQTITKLSLIEPANDEWQEYSEIENYQGFNIAPPYYYNSSNGIGKIKIGTGDDILRGFVRGFDGIYSLDLSNSPTTATSSIGFRCAR